MRGISLVLDLVEETKFELRDLKAGSGTTPAVRGILTLSSDFVRSLQLKTKSTSKKNKLPLSLVQKWQQIKEEVEREEIAEEDEEQEDEDPNVATQKRIEQWKKEQLAA